METILQEVLGLARSCGVSFSLHYCESDNTWWWNISSAARAEEYISYQSQNFEFASEGVIKHLLSIERRIDENTPCSA